MENSIADQPATDRLAKAGNLEDTVYQTYLMRIQNRFLTNVLEGRKPVFTTDADPEEIWRLYLQSFPDDQRQYHNCNSCKRFFTQYGTLRVIDQDGVTRSAIFDPNDAPEDFTREAIVAIQRPLQLAKTTGVYYDKAPVWGTPQTTGKGLGSWNHFSVTPTENMIYGYKKTLIKHVLPFPAMAEKKEDYKNVQVALGEYKIADIQQAVSLLSTDSLPRAAGTLGAAKWLLELAEKRKSLPNNAFRNVLWRAIATAPAGYCHPRGSILGTLIEDISKTSDFSSIRARWVAKTESDIYQRPQTAPSAENIEQAEKMVEAMGIASSLVRRYAKIEEVVAIWRPVDLFGTIEQETKKSVFGHLKPKEAEKSPMVIPKEIVTWAKFSAKVLPKAKSIEIEIPRIANFAGILTAANSDSPPIYRWDNLENRNQFSVYLYTELSSATHWNLAPVNPGLANRPEPRFRKVTAICEHPSRWTKNPAGEYHGDCILLLIEGARDTMAKMSGLFPDNLRSELHSIRKTIEAYSAKTPAVGAMEATACGLMVSNNSGSPLLKVTQFDGIISNYQIDRMD